jgi:hypothetical protein
MDDREVAAILPLPFAMAVVIRLADRVERPKGTPKPRSGRRHEQRFRYPGPDALSEISCAPARPRGRQAAGYATARRSD